jgi:hypothetical protein
MPKANYGVSLAAGGVSIQKTLQREGDGMIGKEVSLAAAKPLTTWVKTDANTAAGNLPGGHGLSNGKFDVYWTGGARYDVDGTISTNALSLDGGSGTDFPDSGNLTVVVSKQTTINVSIDGDALKILGVSLEYASPTAVDVGRVLFEDAAGDDILSLTLVGNSPKIYDVEGGATNPFTGDPIIVAKATHASTSAAATLKIAGADDSTP